MNFPTAADVLFTLQIALSGALAGLIGWQRYRVGRPAGVRTHSLVAMAATAFSIAGSAGFGGGAPHDPARIAAQVVTGIGFLGAGTIFRERDRVYGLTTAATLWLAAGLGVLVAAGFAWIAIFTTALALVILTVVGIVEHQS
jgi:putative Mg2+ transporter-C (MgtC) family protein